MMKQVYEVPETEIIRFETADVIVTSNVIVTSDVDAGDGGGEN